MNTRLRQNPLTIALLLTLFACDEPRFEDFDARVHAEELAAKDRARAATEKRQAQELELEAKAATEREARDDAREAEEANKSVPGRAEWEKSRESAREKYVGMTSSQRRAALSAYCPTDGPCDGNWDLIVNAGRSEAEVAQFNEVARRLCPPCEIAGRDSMVGRVALELIASGKKVPDLRVDANDIDKRHLAISGSFCSQEFLDRLVYYLWDTELRDAGFRTASCENERSRWTARIR